MHLCQEAGSRGSHPGPREILATNTLAPHCFLKSFKNHKTLLLCFKSPSLLQEHLRPSSLFSSFSWLFFFCSYHLLSISMCQAFLFSAQYIIERSNSSSYYCYSWLGQSLNKWRTHWLRVFPGLRGKYISRHLWLCICCKVAARLRLWKKETQVPAVGVKSHRRLVCSKRRKGSIDCVASTTTYTFSAPSLFCVFQWDILVLGCPHPWIISPMGAEPYMSSTLSYPALCWIND